MMKAKIYCQKLCLTENKKSCIAYILINENGRTREMTFLDAGGNYVGKARYYIAEHTGNSTFKDSLECEFAEQLEKDKKELMKTIKSFIEEEYYGIRDDCKISIKFKGIPFLAEPIVIGRNQ